MEPLIELCPASGRKKQNCIPCSFSANCREAMSKEKNTIVAYTSTSYQLQFIVTSKLYKKKKKKKKGMTVTNSLDGTNNLLNCFRLYLLTPKLHSALETTLFNIHRLQDTFWLPQQECWQPRYKHFCKLLVQNQSSLLFLCD